MFRKALSWKAAFTLGALVFGGVLSASQARADKCTMKDIKGIYAGTFTGSITGVGLFTAVARIACDGKGNVSGTGTQSLNGTILPFNAGSGTYTINPNCTGTITVNSDVGPVLHFDVISTEDGKEAWSVETDPGTIISGHVQLITRVLD